MKYIKFSLLGKKITHILLALLSAIVVSSCVEEIEFETEGFESILVINARITDELKHQEILLSRTFRFEEEGPSIEMGATVVIRDNMGNDYIFTQNEAGIYISENEFSAALGVEYELLITTTDGRSYRSEKTTVPNQSPIDNVYGKHITNEDGIDGLAIFVDTFDPTASAIFYGYEYEETYRITAPLWIHKDVIGVEFINNKTQYEFGYRPLGTRVCYKEIISKTLQITNTASLDEDRLTGFQVRFIPADNIEIAERYSILLRQFVQSRAAHGFYQTLEDFSESESLFQQIQPGFITGNIRSENNPNELVLGIFDISSVSSKRIFLDRSDIFDRFAPKYEPTCAEIIPSDLLLPPRDIFERLQLILFELDTFVLLREPSPFGPIAFVSRQCGDCTALGESTPPVYWVD
ncbi:DUF4249 domain-containing protein [Aquimarina sp. RZ0]|uniref:DUF4249 domain-containing protein n=1 Tax=Aquimarina sp. RZ0 TaxID=2607730 RepID=UPI0011F182CF|nr:DUF4249 domain-containing protein [Aquimarina sp. RZ0]KAA1244981.1 DUF4249 domain-containing protein [Aquimarina sp. RZ0]